MTYGLSQKDINEIISILQQFPEVEQAFIFGSRAKGNFKLGSDVDIALQGDNVTHDTVSKILTILNEESFLPYFVDIVHFETIVDRDLKEQIKRTGQCFYQSAP